MITRFSHGGDIYRQPAPPGGWLDFSANINPLGLSPAVKAALQESLGEVIHYPDPAGRDLKSAIGERYGVPVEEIVLGNGAAELFYVFFQTLRPRRVGLLAPSFSEYERAALAVGASVSRVFLREKDGFALAVDDLLPKLTDVDCLVIGNPNNPAGPLVTKADLERLAVAAEEAGTYLLVDESFMDFREDADRYTVRSLVKRYANLAMAESLTKFYAIPGLRLGFALLAPELARRLEAGKDPWNVNLLAQRAGVAALSDTAYREATWAFLRRERRYLTEELEKLPGLVLYEPTANFLLLRLAGDSWGRAANFCERMREEGILVRDCSNYPGLDDRFVRVAVKSCEGNQRFLNAMRKLAKADLA